jgi:hypothetical protein
MNESGSAPPRTCHYFVDEAGDGTLFNKRKHVIVGREGCSRNFILGVLEVAQPKALHEDLEALRTELQADPYLSKIPSLQPETNKTAFAFHAKDDCAEVRREVYKLIMQHDMRFFAVVRDKSVIATKVQDRNRTYPTYRYHPEPAL